MLDVAAVTETLLQAEPPSSIEWAAQAFGLPTDRVSRWIATWVGLHDFGKAIPGFQWKWLEGKQRAQSAGLTFSSRSSSITDHAEATAGLLKKFLQSRSGLETSWILPILQAISAHHGYNLGRKNFSISGEEQAWGTARQMLFEAYWAILSPEGSPSAGELTTAAVEWLAGLTSVADWIGSNVEWFALGERHDSLTDHFIDAKALAAAALRTIGWTGFRPLLEDQPASTDDLIERIVQRPDQVQAARPLQQAADVLLSGTSGPALLLVEAPMGEGKTELAFLAHLRLQAANGHRGLYVALPTQATGNALFGRALTFLQAFAGDQPLDMQLVHGGTALNDQVLQLRSIFGTPGEQISSSAWFSQRRRPLLSPYGVGTIDQALFAVLNVKHHFVRLWGLGNRVVVLDEVHAYDTYTTGLIEALLRWLKALGSSVVLMSATLPHARRDALLQAWGTAPQQIPELPYPRMVLADDRGVVGTSFAARPLPPIQLVGIDEALESLAACALSGLADGGCGAVIVNTVKRAQALYQLLKDSLGTEAELLLFHARFPADQRSSIEQTVLGKFGQPGERPVKALLIATQVAEQSLDIDFDFMLTDLAPVDLILQRAGRLHRHLRIRPATHTVARLFVAGLHTNHLPDLKQTDWQYVYDPYILGRTWALLSRESILTLPKDIDRLVQAVYGNADLPGNLADQVRDFIEEKSFGVHLAKQQDQTQKASNIAIDPAQEPQSAYLDKPRGNEEGEGLGLRNRTRLGDDSIALVPVHVVADGWSLEPAGPTFNSEAEVPDALARCLYARQLSVSHKALTAHFGSASMPRSFAEHPLLRHLKPLPLRDSVYEHADIGLRLRLVPELGLIIEPKQIRL
jgi:CRISPR-associated endonuclease/helicase Cas3